ncbi:MAG: hypothetical protein AAB823_02580 [Patescibacteria group bacterium]|mgnify:CR=1 FL=1
MTRSSQAQTIDRLLYNFYVPFLAIAILLGISLKILVIPLFLISATYTYYLLLKSETSFQTVKSISGFRILFSESVQDLFQKRGQVILYAIPLFLIFSLLGYLKDLKFPETLHSVLVIVLLGVALLLICLMIKTLFLGKRPVLKF